MPCTEDRSSTPPLALGHGGHAETFLVPGPAAGAVPDGKRLSSAVIEPENAAVMLFCIPVARASAYARAIAARALPMPSGCIKFPLQSTLRPSDRR